MKKIISAIVIAIIVILAGIFVVSRFFNIPGAESVPVLGNVACMYPVAVSGNSMEPALKPGERAIFDKCIPDKDNLPIETIIMYKENNIAKIARIAARMERQAGVFYAVERDNRPGEKMEVASNKIIATRQK